MKTVLVFGTFDLIHPGHIFFLNQARQHGDRLVASVARDVFVAEKKGRQPLHSEDERIARIMSTGLVEDAVLSDSETGTYSVIGRFNPDVICLGHDQRDLEADLNRWTAANAVQIKIIVLKSYKPYRFKSSKLNRIENKSK